MSDLLPIIILAGGNDRVETIPDGFTADDLLRGFKGAVKLPSGRCIAGELVERIRESARFEGPILVGPRRIYHDLVDCEIWDTTGDLLATVTGLTRILTERLSAPARRRVRLRHPAHGRGFPGTSGRIVPAARRQRPLVADDRRRPRRNGCQRLEAQLSHAAFTRRTAAEPVSRSSADLPARHGPPRLVQPVPDAGLPVPQPQPLRAHHPHHAPGHGSMAGR